MDHVAAVKAVVFELSGNAIVANSGRGSATASTKAYDALMIPLYHSLPSDVATKVALAYSIINTVGGRGDNLAGARLQLGSAQEALRSYAINRLSLTFPPTK